MKVGAVVPRIWVRPVPSHFPDITPFPCLFLPSSVPLTWCTAETCCLFPTQEKNVISFCPDSAPLLEAEV